MRIMETINERINELQKDYDDLLLTSNGGLLKQINKQIMEYKVIREYVRTAISETSEESAGVVAEFLNKSITKEDLACEFDLKQCDVCESWEIELIDTEGLIGGGIGEVCFGCKGSM